MTNSLIIRVFYPLQEGRIILRTETDWTLDIEPTEVSDNGTRFDFHFQSKVPYFYFKPCIEASGELYWSKGENYLALMDAPQERKDLYPHFFDSFNGTLSDIFRMQSDTMGDFRRFRIYFPPGYQENTLKRYPVLYMHDGANLFSSDEAALGQEWQVDETMDMLDAMNLIDKVIVVGVYPEDRMREYTIDGYEQFGRYMVEELKPQIDTVLRTLPEPGRTATMGSSLGGVVALYLAWQHPDVFGMVACLSSTFGYNDDLSDRIGSEAKRDIDIYIDSAWKTDNYETNRSMRNLLLRKGYAFGKDFLYFAFPEAAHSEVYWALRSHIPFQFLFGKMPDIPAVS